YNSFANHIKDNYLLSVKNSQLTEILDELGYVKKHFELFDAEGNSSSHPCYYNPNTYKSSLKPLLTRSINHQELVNKKVDMILEHIRNTFPLIENDYKNLLDFYLYSRDNKVILVFSNKGIKNYLITVGEEFNFN